MRRRSPTSPFAVLAVAAVLAAMLIGLAEGADAATPSTARVSLSSTGAQPSENSEFPAISANGRWVAFQSVSARLVTGDRNNAYDIFLRDRRTGQTRRISVAADGSEGDFDSYNPSISADGRWIAFVSYARTLVPGATGGYSQVMLYDRVAGTLRRISNRAGSGDGGSGYSDEPRVSSDGAVVVFTSGASDLVTGDGGRQDVFTYRIATGVVTRVSTRAGGGDANGDAYAGAASADGRFVAFSSYASDLVSGDGSRFSDVFVRDTVNGTTTRVSVTSNGGEANNHSEYATISADGCQIAFQSAASNLVVNDDRRGGIKAFVRDRCGGATELVSISNGLVPGTVFTEYFHTAPSISDDGCRVAFVISGDNRVIPAGIWRGVALRDRCQGFTSRIDVATSGEGGEGHTNGALISGGPGRYVVFHSGATNLAGSDANGAASDAYVRDLATTTAPLAALRVTVDGRTVSADASGSSDPDGELAGALIDFGDGGAVASGFTASRTYAAPGSYDVRVTVTDADGLTASTVQRVTIVDPPPPGGGGPGTPLPPPPLPPRATTPVISNATLSRSRFAVVRRGVRNGGATLSVTANVNARATLRFDRALRGRRVRGRCRAGARRGGACTIHRAAGSTTVALRAGANRIVLDGRAGGRALPRGSYRLTLTATAGGRASNTVTLRFAIVAPVRRARR